MTLNLTGWAKSADHAAMDEELEAQAEAALDVIHAAVVRLVRDGGVSPPLVALVVARVAGELGAGIAVADGLGLERVLGELADFVGRAGWEHHALARRERTPAAAAERACRRER
jgi:hypothetical protein